jgi:hypothetical protein
MLLFVKCPTTRNKWAQKITLVFAPIFGKFAKDASFAKIGKLCEFFSSTNCFVTFDFASI